MTVSMQLTKRIYAGNGVTREWEIDFPLASLDDLQVYITSPQGYQTRLEANYELNAAGNILTYPTLASGLSPLASGWMITLVRQTPLTQNIDLLRQGELDAEVLEQGYDKLTLLVQELSEKIDRCIKYPVSTQTTDLETETFLNNILAAKEAAVNASTQAVSSAQAASQSAQSAQSTAQLAVSDISQAKQTATTEINTLAQSLEETLSQTAATATSAAQTAQYYAERTLGKLVGEIYYSQSSLAADNPGALPLFTAETISSADELYPDFYTWISTHSGLQIAAADYETALVTGGVCPKYVLDTTNKTIRLAKLATEVSAANTLLYPWVCVYHAAIPASTAQAAEFQNALSGKTDVDLGNLANAGKIGAGKMSLPADNYADLSPVSGTQYTAPADGWVNVRGSTTVSNGYVYCSVGAPTNYLICYGPTSGYEVAVLLPVRAGQSFNAAAGGATLSRVRFIYAEGSKSLA